MYTYINLFYLIIRSFIRYYNTIHLEINFTMIYPLIIVTKNIAYSNFSMKSFFFFFKFHSCDIKLMKYHIQYIYIYDA